MSNTSLLGSFGGQAGESLMFRNKLTNGCMRVWQRATSGAHTGSLGGSYVSADRWKLVGHQAGISYQGVTLERSTDVPSGSLYSAKAISTAAGLDDYVVGQIIESMNTFDLVGKPATFSVQMKKLATLSGKTLTMEVGYLNTADTSPTDWLNSTGITIIASRIINSTDFATSWGQYTLTTGVLPAQAANGLVVRLCLRGNDLGSGDLFAFTDAALEAGPTATPFERRPYSVELGMAKRYYEKIPYGAHFVTARSNGGNPTIAVSLPQVLDKRTTAPSIQVTGGLVDLADLSNRTISAQTQVYGDGYVVLNISSAITGNIAVSCYLNTIQINAEL